MKSLSDIRRHIKWESRDHRRIANRAEMRKAAKEQAELVQRITRWHANEFPVLLVRARIAGVPATTIEAFKELAPERAWNSRHELSWIIDNSGPDPIHTHHTY